jgi:hypothetical protein
MRVCRSCAAREDEAPFPKRCKPASTCLDCAGDAAVKLRIAERRRELRVWHAQGIKKPGREGDLVVFLEVTR